MLRQRSEIAYREALLASVRRSSIRDIVQHGAVSAMYQTYHLAPAASNPSTAKQVHLAGTSSPARIGLGRVSDEQGERYASSGEQG